MSILHLRAAGTSFVLDARGTAVPRVLHFGADLGALTSSQLSDFADSLVPAVGPSSIDVPLQPSILAGLHEGWSGQPAFSGGSALPVFTLVDAAVSGVELSGIGSVSEGTVRVTLAGSAAASAGLAASGAPAAPASSLEVVVELELSADGVLTLRHTARNTGETAWPVTGLAASLPLPARAGEILDFTGRWPRERQPQRTTVQHGTWLRESRHGRPGHDDSFVTLVGTPGFGFRGGEVWAAHLAWSGDKRVWVESQATGRRALGAGELLSPGEIVLEPGNSYSSPRLVLAWSDRGIDGISRRLHALARAQKPSEPSAVRKVVFNSWEAVYFDHNLPRLAALADTAASVGVERFVLDDGWMLGRIDADRALGDWVVDRIKWPEGLHPLINHVHNRGMDFGLWVEPEMVSLDSTVAREHPEWVLNTADGIPLPWRSQYVLDLANPAAFDHVLGQLDALLREYDIAYLKWDQNRDLLGGSSHRHTVATYRLMDELRTRFPGLEIESCSSGGGRVDLGVMARTDRVWPSDTNDSLERQSIYRYTSILVPPEYFGAHLGAATAHTTKRTHALSFRLATALFGHAGIEWDLSQASETELVAVSTWIAAYKGFRGLLHSGEIVRDDSLDPARAVHGVISRSRAAGISGESVEEALFAVVSLGSSADAVPMPTVLPGLDPARTYRVAPVDLGAAPRFLQDAPPPWWAAGSVTVTGAQLASVGLPMPLLVPEQALVLHVTAV